MERKRGFEKEMKTLLSKKASEEEKSMLFEMGFEIKNPTRLTVLAAAIYRKASSGDLSSLKEILSLYKEQGSFTGGVVLLDDIGKKIE